MVLPGVNLVEEMGAVSWKEHWITITPTEFPDGVMDSGLKKAVASPGGRAVEQVQAYF